jgi:hypothetical protein
MRPKPQKNYNQNKYRRNKSKHSTLWDHQDKEELLEEVAGGTAHHNHHQEDASFSSNIRNNSSAAIFPCFDPRAAVMVEHQPRAAAPSPAAVFHCTTESRGISSDQRTGAHASAISLLPSYRGLQSSSFAALAPAAPQTVTLNQLSKNYSSQGEDHHYFIKPQHYSNTTCNPFSASLNSGSMHFMMMQPSPPPGVLVLGTHNYHPATTTLWNIPSHDSQSFPKPNRAAVVDLNNSPMPGKSLPLQYCDVVLGGLPRAVSSPEEQNQQIMIMMSSRNGDQTYSSVMTRSNIDCCPSNQVLFPLNQRHIS